MLANPFPKSHDPWPSWAAFLRRYRLENMAAWLLESSGPLAIVSAQLIYMGGPLLQPFLRRDQIDSLATLLEDHEEGQAFLAYLHEEIS